MKNCIKIKVVRNNKNRGVSVAYNQGIKSCDAKYILITNNDIVCRKDTIDNLLSFARKTNYGYVTAIDTLRCFKQDYKDFQIRDEEWEGLCNSFFMIPRWVIDRVGYYDENFYPAYMEDIDFLERLNRYQIPKKSTFTSIIKHDEGSSGKGNNWKLTDECNTNAKLYEFAYIKGKVYFKQKWGFCPS